MGGPQSVLCAHGYSCIRRSVGMIGLQASIVYSAMTDGMDRSSVFAAC